MDKNLVSKELQIEGMSCSGCEMVIENKLKKLPGVIEFKASYANANLRITYDPLTIGIEKIIETIEKLDYKVIGGQGNIIMTNDIEAKKNEKMSIVQLLGIGVIILAGYLIIQNTIGFNFIPPITHGMGYGIIFIIGLITSLHCIAMCGGINLAQCVSYKFSEKESGKMSKMKPSIMYNMGRVLSYTIIGGIVGALGSIISFSGGAKGAVAIIAGLFMVIMGLNMLNVFPWLRKINPRMPKIFGNRIYNNNGKHGPFYIGLLNGLMPCGPLQAMQIYALGTGSFLAGAGSMFFFSLGTVPLMFGFGALSSLLSSKFTHRMLKVSAILVIVLGMIMLGRGLNLSGVSFAGELTPKTSSTVNVAKLEGNVQTVTTNLEPEKYTPFTVQKGVPLKWTIKATAENINGCNETITVPKYGITKKLIPGDNLIEFTPKEDGKILVTCWMGMISTNITVVPDVKEVE